MNKMIVGSVILSVLAIGGMAVALRGNKTGSPTSATAQTNVTVVDGKQVIQIRAKGGYAPRVTTAKANLPTTMNVVTSGTYDCSSALTVAAVGFRKELPATGVTPIEIPSQEPGTVIRGVCAMGMYSFEVRFL